VSRGTMPLEVDPYPNPVVPGGPTRTVASRVNRRGAQTGQSFGTGAQIVACIHDWGERSESTRQRQAIFGQGSSLEAPCARHGPAPLVLLAVLTERYSGASASKGNEPSGLTHKVKARHCPAGCPPKARGPPRACGTTCPQLRPSGVSGKPQATGPVGPHTGLPLPCRAIWSRYRADVGANFLPGGEPG